MTDIRTRILRVLRAEMNIWVADFAQTASAVPAGVKAGKIPVDLLDAYPVKGYPVELSRTIAHRIDLPFSDDPTVYLDNGFLVNVTAEAIGVGVDVLRGLRTGDVGVVEEGYEHIWSLYQETLDMHGLTLDELRGYVGGTTWEQAADLICEAFAVPIEVANRATIDGTGGFVTHWRRPGDLTESGWPVPDGQHGMRLAGVGTEVTGTPADLAEMGERIAMRWQSPLVMALSDMGDALHTDSERDFTGFPQALGCRAADALAKVLVLSGHFDTAAQVIGVHAEADDSEETHGHIRELMNRDQENATVGEKFEYVLADAAARDYVQILIASN